MLAAAVMQEAWRAGDRRVRLFCADELRPAACCIVDALLTRGYDVALLTGAEARAGLQLPASADVLRVVWTPDGTDRGTRSRLREALDPDAAGDVLVLPAPTPRGVIEAIEAFGAPRRRRSRMAPRRKTYLAQPTLMERRIEPKRWAASLLGAAAIAIALVGGLWFTSDPAAPALRPTPASVARESMSSPKRDEPVLASTRTELAFEDDADLDDDDDDDVIILDDDAPTRPRATELREDAAPLEQTVAPAPARPTAVTVGNGMPMGAMPTGGRAIDPF